MTGTILTIVAGIIAIVLWFLRRNIPTKKDKARKVVTKANANIQKMRHDLQTRDMDELEADISRAERDMDVLRGLLKTDKAGK